MSSVASSALRKRTTRFSKQSNRNKVLKASFAFIIFLITLFCFRVHEDSSHKVMIIYTQGSYRGDVSHGKPKTFDDTLKLLRWHNAGDLVWQYAASTLIDTTRMLTCRTDTDQCVKIAQKFGISSIMYRPVANLLAEDGTFESRRMTMTEITSDILCREIPVLFVGIGTQGEFSRNIEARDLDSSGSIKLFADDYNVSTEGTLMLRKLEDMKMPLLTRGSYSAKIARRSGMSRAISNGCPSLLINGDEQMGSVLSNRYEILKERVNDSTLRVAINIKPKLKKLLELYLKLGRRYPNSMFFVQESNDVRILQEKGVEMHRIHAAMSYEKWKQQICLMDVSVGSRIHGNMAALGCPRPVPAVVIAADHRVLELSQAMRVPHVTIYDEYFRHDDWFSRIVSELSFNGSLFDQNRCEKAFTYVRVFEAHHIEPSRKLSRIANSCTNPRAS